jgi:predicted DNA binding CopG/RHH family protein
MRKKLPKFSSEAEEREFWAKEDSTEYVDWARAKRAVLPRLKPSLKTISLRLPGSLLSELKVLANKRDVPYQSLLKIFLAERVEQELSGVRPPRKPRRQS